MFSGGGLLALRVVKAATVFLAVLLPVLACAQGAVNLPEVTVNASRVANQAPAVTFAMPVTALRYEPRVDLHGRNLAEGQADITIRGGIFENSAFQVGALTIVDPQTGHYFAELPVAPSMLAAPEIRTGSDLALGATNTTVGAISQGWRPIRTGGAAAFALGEYRLRRAEITQGFATAPVGGAARWGVDVAAARSESDGAVPFGEHEFDRVNVRLQRASGAAQTDLFAGYQGKRFGWPNLYTPFNSNETENLQTLLFALNHRSTWGAGEFVEAGAYHRRNKDDYAFNRFAPVSGRPVGMVVTMKEFSQSGGAGNIVYVNLGNSQGVKVGDYFRIFRYQGVQHETAYRTWRQSFRVYGFGSVPLSYNWESVPREILGEGIVLRVTPNATTLLITLSLREVYAGDYVEIE